MSWINQINWDQIFVAFKETIYMSSVSLIFSIIFGLIIGIILFATASQGLIENKFINKTADLIVNVLRAIPFIILMIILIPLAKAITGSMLGASAALPSLIFAASPFYARLCCIAFMEVDKGTIEASKAMGASNWQIIYKVLLPESLPALVSGACVTAISLISYTAMAGAIGSGGLGYIAYQYGFARRNNAVLFTATAIITVIVLLLQWLADYLSARIDKR
ncbi:MAG: ABC transporter permease [Erysipelotrichaceae bacterium]|nr:ABC transporter permease [Erysipelotrichaceae bacterium]MDY5252246.1 methionine ABC transporter permease [Erysipelotrichaceae bacterium]